ncbi:MAG TPA: alpha/beta hydrolase-fold protein, partial [Anaerolineae bacterium]|nr:alpha/beta hydrolase-fold protein [Anaerolineae bacterium]
CDVNIFIEEECLSGDVSELYWDVCLQPLSCIPMSSILIAILLNSALIISPGLALWSPAVDQCGTYSGRIIRIMVPSTVYGQSIPASVYLPPCYESSTELLPVIYLLHGGGADETQWPDLRVKAEADALIAGGSRPFVVVMPGGVYEASLDYGAFMLDDLMPAIAEKLFVRTDPAGQAIGGISLGGYWALKVTLQHPDQFAAVGGYSPVVVKGSDDLVAAARTAAGLEQLRIALDVGNADALAEGTQQLAEALQSRGLDVSFTEQAGGHDRPYWRAHTGEYLRFMLESLTFPPYWHKCHPHP